MTRRRCLTRALVLVGVACCVPVRSQVEVRAENFTVPPSTGPVTHVLVHNRGKKGCRGAVRLVVPPGWKLNAVERDVELGPEETKRVAFAIERAADAASNSYPLEVSFAGDTARASRRQQVFCGSAPYFRPDVDGQLDEWEDAIPVTFDSSGKKTVVRTYWTKRQFSVAVEVEEESFLAYGSRADGAEFDAVQIAIAVHDAQTPTESDAPAARYEFLLGGGQSPADPDRCFRLIEPGTKLSKASATRPLASLELAEASLRVERRGSITVYECSLPFSKMRAAFRPAPGREFRFSLLVHDPDGTGLRDLGRHAGLWETQRTRLGWCSFPGAKWGDEVPYDSKIEWGLCSSKH